MLRILCENGREAPRTETLRVWVEKEGEQLYLRARREDGFVYNLLVISERSEKAQVFAQGFNGVNIPVFVKET